MSAGRKNHETPPANETCVYDSGVCTHQTTVHSTNAPWRWVFWKTGEILYCGGGVPVCVRLRGGGSLNLPPTGSGWSFGWKRTWSFLEPKFYGIRCYSWTHFRELKMQLWKWPVVKYKHIKIKQRICLCLTWTVNANSLKQNFIVTKEICSWLPPWLDEYRRRFCLQKGVSYTACTKKLPHTHYRSAPRVGSGAL